MLRKFIQAALFLLLVSPTVLAQKQATKMLPAPLFVDPNYYGSCDPEVIWNEADKQWYTYYTSRRALIPNLFTGTPIGVIRSRDLVNWEFAGYCKFDGVGGSKDMPSTFWAPAIIPHGDELHLFVTWKPDTTTQKGPWGGPSKIVHYKTSRTNPINGWTKVADMHDTNLNALDATVYQKDGAFHVWFKAKKMNEPKNDLYHLVSADLKNWQNAGISKSDVFNPPVTGEPFEEAPYIVNWKGSYWLLTDTHKGLMVYQSPDSESWKFQGVILKNPGIRDRDNSRARHCSVLVRNDRAFIVYHVEPWRDYEGVGIAKQPIENHRSVLQMAELKLVDGKLTCDRNEMINLN